MKRPCQKSLKHRGMIATVARGVPTMCPNLIPLKITEHYTQMKKILVISLFSLISLASLAQKEAYLFCYFKGNGLDGLHLASSMDGLHFTALKNDSSFLKPTVSKDKLMRDPNILKGKDGYYHMVWTVSWQDKGIGYARSKDLIHWSEQQFIPVMAHEPTAMNCWAPELQYDEKTQEYVIFWATTIPDRFVSKEEGKGDGKYNHRMYSVSTKDFKTFSPTKLFYDPDFNVIDATIVKDKDQYVMFLKDETKFPVQKNIKIAYSKSLSEPFSAASAPISTNWVEGPTAIKIGNEWIVYYDQYTRHKMGAIKSSDLKTWTDISDSISFPKGTRHGTIFKVSKKELKKLSNE